MLMMILVVAVGGGWRVQVCQSLAESQQNEKQAISTMFEREFKQEKNLEAR